MISAKSLATRFYQLKCGHAPTRASNTGASPSSLQPVEIPAAGALEAGGKGNGLESGPMPASTGVGAVFHGDIRHGGDGLAGGHGRQEVPAGVSGKW